MVQRRPLNHGEPGTTAGGARDDLPQGEGTIVSHRAELPAIDKAHALGPTKQMVSGHAWVIVPHLMRLRKPLPATVWDPI
jgi:hypothetical protein